ncbi:MAG: glycosyl transferase family 2, partial [Thermosynechococcaceae cyanobacterium]
MTGILLLLSVSSISWIYLLAFRGRFWRCDQRLTVSSKVALAHWPSICAIVPARNEAAVLPQSLRGLFTQRYPGSFRVVLV